MILKFPWVTNSLFGKHYSHVKLNNERESQKRLLQNLKQEIITFQILTLWNKRMKKIK